MLYEFLISQKSIKNVRNFIEVRQAWALQSLLRLSDGRFSFSEKLQSFFDLI